MYFLTLFFILSRLIYVACGLKCVLGLKHSDIIYNPLPLYHTAGGLIGIVPVIIYGMSTVIRAKFSASNYFTDCIKYKCTVSLQSMVQI